MDILKPEDLRIFAMEAEAIPFPKELQTPPVTNTNFGMDKEYTKQKKIKTRK
jgi:hypothetical protein